MSENRYYLLDWHARVMDHDPTQDRIVMEDLRADRYPGLWFTTPNPEEMPFAITLQKSVSRPMPLPSFDAVEARDGMIALREAGHGAGSRETYMSSQPNRTFRQGTETIQDWEYFLILDTAMLHGILILAQPHLARIADTEGNALQALTLSSEFKARFGAIDIALPSLRPALAAVASLAAGQSLLIATGDEAMPGITVERL